MDFSDDIIIEYDDGSIDVVSPDGVRWMGGAAVFKNPPYPGWPRGIEEARRYCAEHNIRIRDRSRLRDGRA